MADWGSNVENKPGGMNFLPAWLVRPMRHWIYAFLFGIATFPAFASDADTVAGRTAMPPDLASAVTAYDKATVDKDIARLAALVKDVYVLVNSDMSVQR